MKKLNLKIREGKPRFLRTKQESLSEWQVNNGDQVTLMIGVDTNIGKTSFRMQVMDVVCNGNDSYKGKIAWFVEDQGTGFNHFCAAPPGGPAINSEVEFQKEHIFTITRNE